MLIGECLLTIAGLVMVLPMAIKEQKKLNADLLAYYVPLLQEYVAKYYESPINEYNNYYFMLSYVACYFDTYGIEFDWEDLRTALDLLTKLPETNRLHVDFENWEYSVNRWFPYGSLESTKYFK